MNKKILSIALATTMLMSATSYAATLKEYVNDAGSVKADFVVDGVFDYAKFRESVDLETVITDSKAVKAEVVAEAAVAGTNGYAQYPTSNVALASGGAAFDLKVTLKMDNVKKAYTEMLNLTKVAVGESSGEYAQLLASDVIGAFKVEIKADSELTFETPAVGKNASFTQGADLFEFEGYDEKTGIATFKVADGKTVADLAAANALDDISFVLTGTSVSKKNTPVAVKVKLLAESNTVFTEEEGVSDYAKINYESDEGAVYVMFSKSSSSGGGSANITKPSSFVVTFNTNGGSTIDSIGVSKDETVSEPTAPVKEGYAFAGWYTDEELTAKYDFSNKITGDLILYAAWETTGEPSDDWFEDVKEGQWFYDYVKYAVENNLMNGVSGIEFAPDMPLNRAMLVTILYRAAGEPEVNKSIPFADVNADKYYANAVIWGQQNEIINGITEDLFAPEDDITREQFATILYRYAQYKEYDVSAAQTTDLSAYTDVDEISYYAVDAMKYAVGTGVINGKTATTLNPRDNTTRAEASAMLQRFIESNK